MPWSRSSTMARSAASSLASSAAAILASSRCRILTPARISVSLFGRSLMRQLHQTISRLSKFVAVAFPGSSTDAAAAGTTLSRLALGARHPLPQAGEGFSGFRLRGNERIFCSWAPPQMKDRPAARGVDAVAGDDKALLLIEAERARIV